MSNPKLQLQVNDRCRFRDVGFNLRWFGRRGVALAGIALVIAPGVRARAATAAAAIHVARFHILMCAPLGFER